MCTLFVFAIIALNAGVLTFAAPETAEHFFAAVGMDPAQRIAWGVGFLGSGQAVLLLLLSNLRSTQRREEHMAAENQLLCAQLEASEQELELYRQHPEMRVLGKAALRLQQEKESAENQRDALRTRCGKLEVQVAELQQLQAFLEDAGEYIDADERSCGALLQEVARLQERLQYMVDPETHRKLLAEYHELRGRLATSQEHEKKQETDFQHSLE